MRTLSDCLPVALRVFFTALAATMTTVSVSHAESESGFQLTTDTTVVPDRYSGRLGLAASFDVRIGFHGQGYVANRLEAGGWDYQYKNSGSGLGMGAGIQFSKNILWFQGSFYDVEYSLNDSHKLLQELWFWEIWFRRTIDPFPSHKWFKLIPGIGWGRSRYEVNYEYQDPKLESVGEPGDANYDPEPARSQTLLRTTDNVFSVGVLAEVRSKDKKNTLLLFSIGYEFRVATLGNVEAVSTAERDFPYTFPILGLFEGQKPEIQFTGHYITISIGGLWWAVR